MPKSPKVILDKMVFKGAMTAEERDKILRRIESLSSAQKTGKWKIKAINTFELAYGSTGYEPVYECSLCGGVEESYLRLDEPIMPEDADFPRFCPSCGARMEVENGKD